MGAPPPAAVSEREHDAAIALLRAELGATVVADVGDSRPPLPPPPPGVDAPRRTPPRRPREPDCCEWCDQKIWWATNARSGRRMPINAGEHPDGNIVVVARDGRGQLVDVVGRRARLAGQAALPGLDVPRAAEQPRYRPHHATCPDVDKWSRR